MLQDSSFTYYFFTLEDDKNKLMTRINSALTLTRIKQEIETIFLSKLDKKGDIPTSKVQMTTSHRKSHNILKSQYVKSLNMLH